jgi:hypothetical protein
MSEEIEVPLENVQEHIEHAASHGGVGWITWSALLSAILAVAAAVAALQAGHHANEAMMDQIHASDTWAYYQAKGIKANVLETRVQILTAIGKPPGEEVKAKLGEYSEQQKELNDKAEEHERESRAHFTRHETFATSVTFFQIAIAVTAISVLTRRRRFLGVTGIFGLIGLVYLCLGFLGH